MRTVSEERDLALFAYTRVMHRGQEQFAICWCN